MKTYIQIGANIGEDDFFQVVSDVDEKIRVILIEPNPKLITELSINYEVLKKRHEIIICSFGVSLINGLADLFLYINQYNKMDSPGVSSLLDRKTHPIKSKFSIKIPVVTFSTLCEAFAISEIECLFIDTEGLDYEILNSIDTSKIDINTIVFEQWAYDSDDLNGIYRTGPTFLNKFIVPKFKDYMWETIMFGDNMENYKLTKKN